MKFAYFDASSGLSGDMILGALLDLGAPKKEFRDAMAELRLPVEIKTREVMRAGLRGLKVDVVVMRGKESPARHWHDVESLILKSPYSEPIKERALGAFKVLFEAEARVHGSKFHDVHLHEAGADDAMIDVVGSAFLRERLDISRVVCSPLNLGSGWVKASHGRLPVPPPAVAEILKKVPVYSAWVEQELVTPTGAAIISSWAEGFAPLPQMSYEKIGCGAGGRDPEALPNILRVFYGNEHRLEPEKTAFQVEANIDDANPQVLSHFVEVALGMGALDAFLTPVVMKKGRLGTKLTLLAGRDKVDALIEAVFAETTSIGLRYFPVGRRILERGVRKVKVFGEEIAVKTASLGPKELNAHPEFSDCLEVAKKKGVPVKTVCQKALQAYLDQESKRPKE
ncbi:MAG: TIGR00299 family protein [Candidatus Aminicenantes bacterium RBG_16_63_16]|nr:MAG: TIGR00299 family protein [Candidatus Aminicenantes bacterium RBG_16_63_16]